MHSNGLYSAAGTCFSAAAWMTMSMPSSARRSRVLVAHVADEIAQRRILGRREVLRHLVLLQLVARIDDQPLDVGIALEHRRTKALPNEPVPPVTNIDLSFSMMGARVFS